MDRRTVLKSLSLCACWTTAGFKWQIAVPTHPQEFHRFKVGSFNCLVINDGIFPKATANFLFGDAPERELNKLISEYHVSTDLIDIPINPLVVDTGSQIVLVDTGYGELAQRWDYPAGKMLSNLAIAGLHPSDVDYVILTHSHPDHIGGVADANGKPVFTRAKHLIRRKEWDFVVQQGGWQQEKLGSIKELLELVESDIEVISGIKTIDASGHTPGHTMVMVHSDGEQILSVSDLLGHDIHIEHPEWSMSHEFSRDKAAEVRRQVVESASRDNILLHAFHLEFPGLGRIVAEAGNLKWRA